MNEESSILANQLVCAAVAIVVVIILVLWGIDVF